MVPGFQPNRHFSGPLYRMPIMAAVVGPLIPPIALAVARNAIEEVKALSSKRVPMASMVPLRDRGVAQARLGSAEARLRAARAALYDALAETWERTLAGTRSTLQQKADVMLAGAHAAQTGAEVVDMMFTSGGSSAVFDSHPLQKLFRDSQVIRQHGFVCAARYETYGQVAMGLAPDLPFLHF
jgi:alkylation response protein AidB-like acyl-CoA dehydrogenase